jgi:hypothetical protein
MPDPLVLYSVNTLMAYRINEHFYGQIHYVWCSPFFNAGATSALDNQAPPSSTPCDICRAYLDDVQRQDRHSAAIRNNRSGIKSGLAAKRADGVISAEQHRELEKIVSKAPLESFGLSSSSSHFRASRSGSKKCRSPSGPIRFRGSTESPACRGRISTC